MGRITFFFVLALLTQVVFPQSAAAACPEPDIIVTPEWVDFGPIPVGQTSLPETVAVTNGGDANLILYSVEILGTDASQFFIASAPTTSPIIIPPGATASGTVKFAPTSTGIKSAHLRFHSNDPYKERVCVTLIGTGIVTPPTEPDISVNPTEIDFGEVEAGTSSSSRNVTVTNEGNADLIIGNLTINDGRFSISTGNISGQTLTPGFSENISLVFTPDYAGLYSANLTIPSNDPDENPVYVALSGTGTEAPSTEPDISVSPVEIDFGLVESGTSSSPETVTITNIGTADLIIGAISIGGPDSTQFNIFSDSASGQTLPTGTPANVSVTFSPTSQGSKLAHLIIFSNDPDTNPFSVILKGTGTQASGPDILVSPLSLNFGPVNLGSPSASQNVTVTNEGGADLIIGNITIDDSQFSISSGNISGQTLTPGSSANISIVFTPNALGIQSANLTIPSNDFDENPVYVALYGTGAIIPSPDISVSPVEIDFGLVESGTSSSPETVTISNIGTADLIIGTISTGGPDSTQFNIPSDNASGQTLTPGTSANVSVTFNPTSQGSKLAHLIILSNDPDTNPFSVILKGTGIAYGTIHGTVFEDLDGDGTRDGGEAGIAGVTISLGSTENTTTDAQGQYSFKVETAGLYTVTETDPDGYFSTTPNNRNVNVEPGNSYTVDFGDTPITSNFAVIYGIVFDDINTNGTQESGEEGLSGANVSLNGTDNTTTNANGLYTIRVETTGSYTVTETDPNGYFSTTPNNVNVNVVIGNSYRVDFGDTLIAPDINVSPVDIDFGSIDVGSSSSNEIVTVTNIGTANLTIGVITTTDGQFVITSDNVSNQTLTPSASAKLSLTFTPDAVGAQSANLTIPSNDPDENPFIVPLSGTGIEPDILITPATVDFGSIPVGSSSSPATVTVTNTGNAPLQIGTFHTAGTDYDQFNISNDNASGKTLDPGENATLQVTFSPLSAGSKIAGLEVSSNDPDEPTASITLTGTGLVPDINVTPLDLNLGSVPVNSSGSPGVVTVSNTGEAPLNVGTILIVGLDAGYFEKVSDNVSNQSLAAGASANISVRFNPTIAGVVGAQLYIPSNDPDEPSSYVTIYGTGIEPDIGVSPTTIDFGFIEAGQLSVAKVVTVTNEGTDDLVIGTVTIAGTNPLDFNIVSDNVSSRTLLPGASANVSVRFSPASAGGKDAELRIPSNDPDEDPASVTLTGTGTPEPVPDIDVTPMTIDFTPPVIPGNYSSPETITIRNAGTANLTIGTILITGTNPGDFIISSDNASGKVLAPGVATTVQLRFKPTDTGARTGTLQIPSDDPDEDPVNVALSGTGEGVPIIQITPYWIDFGPIQVGLSSPSRTVTIKNIGSADLKIGSIYIGGWDSSHFKIISDNASGKTLAPGASANVSGQFSPKTTGDMYATLEIPSNSYYDPDIYAGLYGEGTTAPEPRIYISPTWIDFGTVPVGSTSPPGVVTITNIGGADLEVYPIVLDGADKAHFSIVSDNVSGKTLPPGVSANFSVEFSPTNTGPKWSYIYIDSNDYYAYPYVDFTGNADPAYLPDITVEPLNINFGSIDVGSSSAIETVTITNDGNNDLDIGAITKAGSDGSHFAVVSDNASNQTLAPGASANVSVQFSPTSTGFKSIGLRIPSNDHDENPTFVTLTGTGLDPDIDVVPMSIDFGYLLIGDTSSQRVVTVTNVGTENLTVGTIDITGADALQFEIVSDNASSQVLPPGVSANVSVRFMPTATGAQSANLTIPSNDPDEDPVNVSLSGTGTETPPAPEITVDPLNIDFGSVAVGATSATENVTVTNDGTAGLTIGNLTINDDQFSIASGNISGQILLPGVSANISLVFAPGSIGAHSANLTIPSDDADENPVNVLLSGTGMEPPPPEADLAITKSDSPDPVGWGDNLTYTLTVTNNGPATAAGASVIDNLPDGTTFLSADPSTGTAVHASGNVTWDIGDIPAGNTVNMTIVVEAPILEITANITNTATVTGSYSDPVPENNIASENTTVVPPYSADLLITKTDSPDPVATSGNLTYIITVKNNGPGDAAGVSVIDNLPEGTVYQSATPSSGTANHASGNVTWNIGSLGYGDSANMTILVTAPPETGTITNTTGVSSATNDPIPANNTAFALTTVQIPANTPDIDVNPTSVNFGRVNVGSSSSARIVTVTNAGTANLTIYNISIDNTQFAISSGNISGQILPPGASANITLIFSPASAGVKTATMSITSNDPDEATVNVTLSGRGSTPPSPGPPRSSSSPPPAVRYFTVDFLGEITQEVATNDGRPVKRMEAPSPDEMHLLEIEEYTGATDNTGGTVTLIEIREAEAPELPENTVLVGQALKFNPAGTAFDKYIRLTLGYNVNDLPEYVVSVGAAYFTIDDGWVYLETETTSVAELGKLSAQLNHFTIFAVLAKVSVPPPPETTPPEIPEPTLPEGPKPQPPPAPAAFKLSNLSITTSVTKYFEHVTYIVRTGEEALIAVDITNNGGQSGSYTAILIINDKERDRKDVTLEPGQTKTVTFTVTDNEPGTYNVVIGELTEDFLSKLSINWWLFTGSAAALILIIWLVRYLIKRKKQPII